MNRFSYASSFERRSLTRWSVLSFLACGAFFLMQVPAARADGQSRCIVTCPPDATGARAVFTDTSRTCTVASVVRDCATLCERQCGATACGNISQFRCAPPDLPVDAASARGTCGFTCEGSAAAPNAVIPCNQDAECAAACDNVCATTAHRACGGAARCVPRAATPGAARADTSGSSITLTNPLGANVTFQTIISRVIRAMIGLIGSLALLMFVYGGIRWMVAGGSESEIKEAKNIIKYAALGLLMILLSYTLVSAFLSAFTTA